MRAGMKILCALGVMVIYFAALTNVTAQNITRIEYFVNSDPGFGNATQLNGFPVSSDIQTFPGDFDISNAENGINTIFIRAEDSNGKWSITNSIPFIKTTTILADIIKAEYFVDVDPGFDLAIDIPVSPTIKLSNLIFIADVSSVTNGIHTFYIRAKDRDGKWSLKNSIPFLTGNFTLPNIARAEYFVDSDPGFGNALNVSVAESANIYRMMFTADLSSVTDGVHTLYIRGIDAFGKWSTTESIPFFKGNINLPNIVLVEYFVDNDPGFGNGTLIPVSGYAKNPGMEFLTDISSVSNGIHTFYIRGKDALGRWSIINSIPFVKQGISSPQNIMGMEYYIDIDPGFAKATPITSFIPAVDITSFVFNADVSASSIGNHNLFIRAVDANGVWSLTNVISFIKTVNSGVSEINSADNIMKVYPNPGDGNFRIDISEDIKLWKLEIIDVSGKIIYSETKSFITNIDISAQETGVYFIRIVDKANNIYYTKVIKE